MKYTGIYRTFLNRRKSRRGFASLKKYLSLVTLTLAMISAPLAGTAYAIQNSATGNNSGIALDMTNSTVTLSRGGYPEGGFIVGDIIPAAEIIQATDGSGIITINWKGRDGQTDNVTLKNFEYSTDGGFSWSAPTNGDLSTSLSANWDDNGGAEWTTATTFAAAVAHSFSFDTKHVDVAGIDNTDQNDIKFRFTLNDGLIDAVNPSTTEDLRIDDLDPTDTITSAVYDNATDTLTITGTNFLSIAAATTDIKSYVDWTKLSWDINGDDAITANISIALGDVSSLTVTNNSTLTLLFTAAKATAIEATAGYGAAGGADTLDVTAGFSIDAFGNVAGSDGINDAPLAVIEPLGVSPTRSTLQISPEIVVADGLSAATMTATLLDSLGEPVPGKAVSFASSRGVADSIVQPGGLTSGSGQAVGLISSNSVGIATITATDTTDTISISTQRQVYFTQGRVLKLTKRANKDEAEVGDVVTYQISIANTETKDIVSVNLNDTIPPNFKYLKGSTRFNGSKVADPAGNRPLRFNIGTLPAMVDTNGNGEADSGEAGYMEISYQLIIGSGATPGDYTNSVVAVDSCDRCYISNVEEEKVSVTFDPLFDLGTIIGKVFEDKNSNGYQDSGEAGIAGAMVVLDNGSYIITDEYGRYHFPAIKPGQRLLKINMGSLPEGSFETTDEARIFTVSPGLLAKVNFGVISRHDRVSIGRDKELGMIMISEENKKPLHVMGSAETLTVLINGEMAPVMAGNVKMMVQGLDDIIEINDHKLKDPVEFALMLSRMEGIESWKLLIRNSKEEVLRTISGEGRPPEMLIWDGMTEGGKLIDGGEIYNYQIEAAYEDGTITRSAREIFGVNMKSTISLNLTGGAFKAGSTKISAQAEEVLTETAKMLRRFPEEKIIIEGHADSIGSRKLNLELSRKRAESARDYLVNEEGIPEDRFMIRAYGEAKPLATNRLAEGREINRRVEIKGEMKEIDQAKLHDQYRTAPMVKINGSLVDVDRYGRFMSKVDGNEENHLNVALSGSQGGSLETAIPIPLLEIIEPKGKQLVSYGEESDTYRASRPGADGSLGDKPVAIRWQMAGLTEAGNIVEIDGREVAVDDNGLFSADLELKLGRNVYGLTVKNPEGFLRIADLNVDVNDRDSEGNFIITVDPIPQLSVKLPVEGVPLKNRLLTISGKTDSGNRVEVNGQAAAIQSDGTFASTLKLPHGKSHLSIRATDGEGYEGTIERDVEVDETQLFFLAFADGKIGQMKGKGYIEGAGMKSKSESYTEGRVAYYLKGVIKGKYLITSAFDSGSSDLGDMFKGLDGSENDLLLSNLDPDKLYPVYGDSSTLVHDAQSQGKFYLALESDELDILVGNYQLNLSDTELASYQRTLYGARAFYQSTERTIYGDPDTKVIIFGAEVRQTPVRDELRATGGSLYYLSHGDIIEGSEQLTITVRDKNTGLVLSRTPQEQNVDYRIKYEEGRIIFDRPVSSVSADDRIVNEAILGGNPVYIEVDYESRFEFFEKSASGGRLRKQISDHVAVGTTYVKDDTSTAAYELQGFDTEFRFGKNSKITAEMADSSGVDNVIFVSEDGGLSYSEITPSGSLEGQAWKISAELDLGEWLGNPGRYSIGSYMKELEEGFLSGGNFLERGSTKYGFNTRLKVTDADTLSGRYDHEEYKDSSSPSGLAGETNSASLQWKHQKKRWSIAAEYFTTETLDGSGAALSEASYLASRLDGRISDDLNAFVEHQSTIDGPENDQTSIGADYGVTDRLDLTARATDGTRGQSAEGGVVYNMDGGKIYATERVEESQAGDSNATIMGAESRIADDSRVYTEYQWLNSDRGDESVSLLGAERAWGGDNGFRFSLSGERSEVESASGQTDRFSISAGLSYKDGKGLKASTRNEIRRESGTVDQHQYLTVNHLEFKMGPDFTMLNDYRYSTTIDRNTDEETAGFEVVSIGLAYRPVAHDRFNALSKFTHLSDMRPLSLAGIDSLVTSSDVLSLEWSLQLSRRLEWVGKEAVKIKEEKTGDRPSFTSHTYLHIHRMNYHMMRKLDLAAEYRILKQKEAKDQREGWLTEVSWQAVKHLRLGAGYNFTDFSDNEFSDNNYSVYGWFIRLQSKY